MNRFLKSLFLIPFVASTLPMAVAETTPESYITSDPFETMVRLGRISEKSPIYQMPAGSASGGYIATATTSGNAIIYPLGYNKTSTPSSYFTIVSKETSLLIAGKSFELNATMTVDPSSYTITAYTDWDRNGIYEKESQTAQINASTRSFVQPISIPETAALGKTRVRMRIESSTPASADASISGRIYDFVVYVMEASNRTDCFIGVTSSNSNWGTALIETEPNDAGRYEIGSEVTVKAIINEEAEMPIEFKGWQEGGEIVSQESVYTFTVSKSTSLVALFEAEVPELATPEVSTAEEPIWYQIMNAHTAEARKERYIAYDTNTNTTYTKALRVEKPADQTDKFLWRLEDAGNDRVYIVNKGTDLRISGSKVLEKEYFTASANGSQFVIAPSGNANGSYSIKYEGDDSYLLNAQEGTWGVVLYNAGIGTGSGWYFYKVPIKTATAIDEAQQAAPKGRLYDGHLTLTGLDGRNRVRVVSLTGQLLGDFLTTDTTFEGDLRYAERFIIIAIESETGNYTTLKLIDSKL